MTKKPNQIRTSKYTLYNFIPLNMYQQFTKYNNLFFLITLILLTIPQISPFSLYTYLIAFSLIISVSIIKDAIEDIKRHQQDEKLNEKGISVVVKENEEKAYGKAYDESTYNESRNDIDNGSINNKKEKSDHNADINKNVGNNQANQKSIEQQNENKAQKNYEENKKTQNVTSKNKESNTNAAFKVVIKRVEDLCEGDVVVINEHGEVPADVVLLGSEGFHDECKKFCFIETSNLDGENNLKRKTVAFADIDCNCEPKNKDNTNSNNKNTNKKDDNNKNDNSINNDDDNSIEQHRKLDHKPIYSETNTKTYQSIASVNSIIRGTDTTIKLSKCDIARLENIETFQVQETGELLNDIKCVLNTKKQKSVQTDKNVLLKGSKLKNTHRVLGLVVSVGTDTKQSKNLSIQEMGMSLFSKRLNKSLAFIFIGYFIVLFILSILTSLFIKRNDISYLYLPVYRSKYALYLTGTNYILFSFLIPISLFVTIEIARVFMVLYIRNDVNMNMNGISTSCRNSNVIEDLGMVDVILSDKTGTLTSNSMKLVMLHLSTDNEKNCEVDNLQNSNTNKNKNNSNIDNNINSLCDLFYIALLCCNSAEKFHSTYEGPSQDEICILEGIKDKGEITQRKEKSIKITYKNTSIELPILLCLDFSSKRQRMSIITKLYGKYYLFTKGSDQVILKNVYNTHKIKSMIDKNSFYRSLVVAYKEIKNYEEIKNKHDLIGLENRNTEIEALFCEIENNLIYLGTTFVEDSLQDGIEKCIDDLYQAGLSVWMVTGDKKETAMSCGTLCGIKKDNTIDNTRSSNTVATENDYKLVYIKQEQTNESGSQNNNIANSNTEYQRACDTLSAEDMLKKIERNEVVSKSAIIFRASPEQKSKIAKYLVNKGLCVLAIGDGNNDVMMLQSSSIGVGIIGKEGTQASLSADFSVPSFKCLNNLLFIHGRYNYMRFSKVTVNSFYKNLLLIFTQFYYSFFNGYSGRAIFNFFFLNYFNVLFTSLIPFYVAIFDKDKPEETLLQNPIEYKKTKHYFATKAIVANILLALFKSSLIFWLTYFIVETKDFVCGNGYVGGYACLNNFFSLIIFCTVMLRQYRMVGFRNIFFYICVTATFLLYFITIFAIQEFSDKTRNSAYHLYSIPMFYFAFIAIFGVVMMIDWLWDMWHERILYK
ncbi:Phospholipid-transporting ATPase IA [Binucleata daphniae]